MKTLLLWSAVAGLCAGFMANSAVAEDNHFLGQWQWNKARSKLAPDEPAPQDVRANIQNADNGAIRWSAEITDNNGRKHAETFDGKPDGTFYPVQGAGDGVTAAFTWNGGTLQSVFKHPSGGADTQSCHVEANNKTMACNGTWTDGKGVKETYIDVYDRI
ncbi:MAG TPA: hypothetical protein VGB82_14690 [Alphaproteobacteria bacterium]